MSKLMYFTQYKNRHLVTFYKKTAGKRFLYKGHEADKFEIFATLYNRYFQGNSEREIDVVIGGMSDDFMLVPKRN